MSQVEKVSIALTAELAEKVRQAVSSGDYASTSEVVRDALRDWVQDREERARIRRLWEEGLASGVATERRSKEEFLSDARTRLAKIRGA
ncbi:MAG TPA: type II toxin-antitoxin system ParD family antitoxin [Caulobacteraceae bacterium]|jgi:antitoxin ParD1/3/4|nr:type II toxin-antitoxin system ParD family antitoxin [Caulobacteraceae bacterium]